MGTPAELHALVSAFQERAKRLGLPPLLVGMDQEGGIVSRLKPPFTIVPGQMAQAATGDPDVARQCAEITAVQLRVMGVNLVFAPVVDVNSNPRNPVIGIRSFGENAETVAAFATAAMAGFREQGIIATAKHFPGHGDTDVDSHDGLPVIPHDRERLDAVELVPFRAAIAAGVPAMMTGHIVFPELDALPATLSPAILDGLLRQELGFDGLIFSDALEMDAVNERYGVQAAALAKAAGVDVVLPVGSIERQDASFAAMRDAVDAGAITVEALHATARRLEKLREAYDVTYDVPPFETLPEWIASATAEIATRSVTVIHGGDELPLSPRIRLALVDWSRPRWSLVAEAVERTATLRSAIMDHFPNATCVVADAGSSDDHLRAIDALVAGSDAVVLVTRDAVSGDEQRHLIYRLTGSPPPGPLVHIAVRGPYDAGLVPGSAVTLLTYGDPPPSLRAVTAVLAGEATAAGVLPVTLANVRDM